MPRAAEFFAGIGLVRQALEEAEFEVAWANDIDPRKSAMYRANFDDSHYLLADVRDVRGKDVPRVELATASFPCTDLSLAGNRAELSGRESSMFWEFARILDEMGKRRPAACLLENVPGFATSHGGADLRDALAELNRLGYWCDLFLADAAWFVPQSRVRLFIVGSRKRLTKATAWDSPIRPLSVRRFAERHPELRMQAVPVVPELREAGTLRTVVERLRASDNRWWDAERNRRFVASLTQVQAARLHALRMSKRLTWATAYRRTRGGRAVWEIRADEISGCLRTARGGSSKQALVEAGRGKVRIRWMTPREYARLQGAPDYDLGDAGENQALFGFGDAVCVPVVSWIARDYLRPLLAGDVTATLAAVA